MITRLLVSTLVGIGLSSAALAQSLTAPAGIPAVTAPGGIQGRLAVPVQRPTPEGRVAVIDADGRPQPRGRIVHPPHPGHAR
ncbi:hypothetical protein MMSR116_17155 [Methylobacterium mesophilicum SR1.6/6]|uniref:Uncharacterized protein n=1 Tax=Methylobacterium mesophilicum SR1.6/6 TaxID=908290 RepID=A0A6B9FQV8_9HYPH|nr:hypothetical protein [Methylobacterium mesophilicum]QGY03428.1 hypothetical protein MMSR116_17155 [Methylobacterium mesophilicum SR1.6/6]